MADTFEVHLKRVEDAVKSLESGALGLEESIIAYETGTKALQECYAILGGAEAKIQLMVKNKDGSHTISDFEGGAK